MFWNCDDFYVLFIWILLDLSNTRTLAPHLSLRGVSVDKILLILVVHNKSNTDVLKITFEHVCSSKIYGLSIYTVCTIHTGGLRHMRDQEEK